MLRAARAVAVGLGLLASAGHANAAFERGSQGPGRDLLAGGGIATGPSPWGSSGNPAASAGLAHPTFAFIHIPSPYGLAELDGTAGLFNQPAGSGTFSLHGSRFGFELYREVTVGVSYAAQIAEEVAAGATVTYYHLRVAGYGSAGTVGVDVGLQWTLARDLRMGLSAGNLNAPTLSTEIGRLPQTLAAGVSYEPAGGIVIMWDFVKDLSFPLEARCALDCAVTEQLTLRGAVMRKPLLYALGFGVNLHPFTLEYAIRGQEPLGVAHTLGLAVTLGAW